MTPSDANPNPFFMIVRRRFSALWAASAWCYVLMAICYFTVAIVVHNNQASAGVFSPTALWGSLSTARKCGILLLFVVQLYLPRDLAAAGGAIVVSADQRGETLSVPSLFARVMRLLPLIAPVSVLLGALTMLGSIFFVLPGIAIDTFGSLMMPSLAVRPGSAWNRIVTGFRAGVKRFLPVFATNVLAGAASVLALVLLFAGRVVGGDGPYWWTGFALGWILFAGVISLAMMARSVALALLLSGAVREMESAGALQAP